MRLAGCLLLAGCVGDPQVLCSESIDHAGQDPTWFDIVHRIENANQPLLFHGHVPGELLKVSTVERVLAEAKRHHLPIIRYDQIPETHRGAIALAIDDNAIDDWYALRPVLAQYDAHITFFVSRWAQQGPQQIDELMQLAADGNELEPHTVNHLQPLPYVAANGIDAWLENELDPSIQIMRDHGLTPQIFAYPFGQRDDELDAAVFTRLPVVRAVGRHCKR